MCCLLCDFWEADCSLAMCDHLLCCLLCDKNPDIGALCTDLMSCIQIKSQSRQALEDLEDLVQNLHNIFFYFLQMRFQHRQFTKQIWIQKKHKKVQREFEVTQVFYLCFDRFEDSDVFNQQLLLVLCCSHFYPYRVLVMVFEDACNNL